MSTYQDRYIYPSIFDFSNEQVTVTFPDLTDCHANGNNYEDAFEMAKKTLATHLYEIEENKGTIPPHLIQLLSKLKTIKLLA